MDLLMHYNATSCIMYVSIYTWRRYDEKIHIEFSDERLITPSGLVFVGQILGKSNFVKKINRAPISDEYLQKQIKNGDILLTDIGMLCQGKPQYEAVRE